jgi:hypothetical protein
MYENIKSLRPYFFSLREFESNVSLDIKIPITWKYADIAKIAKPPVAVKTQDKNEKVSLLSLISTATDEGYDSVFSTAEKIIKTNQEEEEKIKLFNLKVEELKKVFLNSPLEKLKDITFIKEKKNKKNEPDITKIELAGRGDEEGSGQNGQS